MSTNSIALESFINTILTSVRSRKENDVVTTLSQRRTIGCINAVSSLEMKVSPTSVDYVVAMLRSDVLATLW